MSFSPFPPQPIQLPRRKKSLYKLLMSFQSERKTSTGLVSYQRQRELSEKTRREGCLSQCRVSLRSKLLLSRRFPKRMGEKSLSPPPASVSLKLTDETEAQWETGPLPSTWGERRIKRKGKKKILHRALALKRTPQANRRYLQKQSTDSTAVFLFSFSPTIPSFLSSLDSALLTSSLSFLPFSLFLFCCLLRSTLMRAI